MLMFADAEVQHPAGVGTKFIEARIDRVFEHEVPVAIALFGCDDALSLHHHTIGRHQFHIENMTHVRIGKVIGAHHVSLIPDGITFEVALVVQMQIHLLLYGRIHQHTLDAVKAMLGMSRETETQQQENGV